MAKLVEAIGVTHNPFLPRVFREDRGQDPGIDAARENFALMHRKLAAAKPDVIIVVGSDHLNQWFMDNMPAFLVGKARLAVGPFPDEVKTHALAPYRAEIDGDLARALLRGGLARGVDFAFSDEFTLDHSFTMPLELIRPEMDVPVVPIFTNTIAPPMPLAQRFYDVGVIVREIIEELGANKRVAVIASGHMSLDVGGPKTNQSVDPEFDRRMMTWIAQGNWRSVIKEATWERMFASGNQTPGFSNFIFLQGLARGAPASYTDLNPCRFAASPFMTWEPINGASP